MPYNPETERFEQDPSTVVDSTPDGDSVRQGFDDRATPAIEGVYNDLNLLKVNGMIGVGVPATETARGIGRSATAAEVKSGVTGANGPAWVRPESLAESLVGQFAYLMIGAPIYQPTTTLPANCMWPDGSLALFIDWPEFAAKYRAGGFAGMVDNSSNSANLGKFVLNANGTGLYLPRHGGQFMRNWCPGFGTAGAWTRGETFNVTGKFGPFKSNGYGSTSNGVFYTIVSGGGSMDSLGYGPEVVGMDISRQFATGSKNKPDSIDVPTAIYMGTHA